MSLAALCGSQGRNSVVSVPPTAPSSLRRSEPCGCSLASSAGGLKSTCVFLLELSPASSAREEASTWSERGGARFGLGAGNLSGADLEPGFCDLAGAGGDEFWAAARLAPSARISKLRICICYTDSTGPYPLAAELCSPDP